MRLDGGTQGGVTLHDYLRVVKRRKWIILQAVVIVPLLAVLLAIRQPPVYQATSQVLLSDQNLGGALTGIQSGGFYQIPERKAQTQADLARTPDVANMVVKAAGLDWSPEYFLAVSSVVPKIDSDLLLFTVSMGEPGLTSELATEYGRQYAIYKGELDTANIRELLGGVSRRIEQLEAAGDQSSALYSNLLEKQQQLEELQAVQTNSVSLVNPAGFAFQVQPTPVRNGLLGLMVGIALGLLLAFLREALDTRIRSAEEVEERLGLPLLARLPAPPKRLAGRNRLVMLDDPTSTQAEGFRMLRTNLEFVNLDRDARSIVVTSALESEGKSTTVANLALALARSGKSVVLVDLDLRRPYLDRFFGLQGRPGLTQVALGHVELKDALVPIVVSEPGRRSSANGSVNGGRAKKGTTENGAPSLLEVLPSGPIPPDAGEFVGTSAVASILEVVRGRADVVLVDAPPLLSVGDAMVLSSKVDAVIVVTRLKVLRRQTLRELNRVLEACRSKVLGFVVTGAETEEGYGYGYGYATPGTATGTGAPRRREERVR